MISSKQYIYCEMFLNTLSGKILKQAEVTKNLKRQ
jgi:hypothetical protein